MCAEAEMCCEAELKEAHYQQAEEGITTYEVLYECAQPSCQIEGA